MKTQVSLLVLLFNLVSVSAIAADRPVKYDTVAQVTAQKDEESGLNPGFIELSVGVDANGKILEVFSEEVKDPEHRTNRGQVFPINDSFRSKGITLQKVSTSVPILGRVSRVLLSLKGDRAFSLTSGGVVTLTFKKDVVTGSSQARQYTLEKNAQGKWELRKNSVMFNKIHIVGGSRGINTLTERKGSLQ